MFILIWISFNSNQQCETQNSKKTQSYEFRMENAMQFFPN